MKKTAPLAIRSAADAFRGLSGVAWYPKKDKDPERLEGLPGIAHDATFRISRDDKVFAIGSCFAREIENALNGMGMNVASRRLLEVEKDSVSEEFQHLRNKYTTKSIAQDLRWALEGVEEATLVETYAQVGEDQWLNFHFGGGHASRSNSKAAVLAAHLGWLRQMAAVSDCRVVIITLGLVEVWYDRVAQIYTNIAPPKKVVAAEPDRYEMHVLSYEQILEDLEAIHELLARHCRADQQILLTVSPVPLHATFRDQDVLQANCYSKAVLRAAAEAFHLRHKNVSYFPSYETVTLADRGDAWIEADYRHVNSKMVAHIMRRTLEAYVDDGLPKSKEELGAWIARGRFAEVLAECQRNGGAASARSPYLSFYEARAHLGLGDPASARPCLLRTLELAPKHASAMTLLAEIHRAEGNVTGARELLERALDAKPLFGPALRALAALVLPESGKTTESPSGAE